MRKVETTPKKVLLLPLIPVLALGIVAVLADAPPPTTLGPAPISDVRRCTLEDSEHFAAPVVEQPPIRIEPPSCINCTMSF